ncbi:MAG: mandelate racemase/muconate lactonizing enzyme family protein [Acidimicrobiales bacterium]
MSVQIASVEPITVTFGLDREAMSYCFVRIESTDGLVGYGEACDSYGVSYANVLATVITDAFAPLLVGQQLDAVEPLADRMRLFTRRRLGDQWIAPQARSAVEIALWDLLGRSEERSVSSLIGRLRDRIPVYASSVFLEEGDASFHLDLLQPLLERGVSMVKTRIGPEWRADLATLGQLREKLGPDVEIMIDGSEIFTLPTAIEVSRGLHDLDVRWFEEPLPQGERAGIAALASASPVALAYGEHLFGVDEAIDLLSSGRASILQPDASTCGGIIAARAMAAVAPYYGARVVPHVCAGPISLAANLHVAATVPAIRAIEFPFTLAPAWEALSGTVAFSPAAIVDGSLAVPDGAGLGCVLDEVVAAANPYRSPGARVSGTTSGLPDRFVGDR